MRQLVKVRYKIRVVFISHMLLHTKYIHARFCIASFVNRRGGQIAAAMLSVIGLAKKFGLQQ